MPINTTNATNCLRKCENSKKVNKLTSDLVTTCNKILPKKKAIAHVLMKINIHLKIFQNVIKRNRSVMLITNAVKFLTNLYREQNLHITK